ncbi:uncharacterized protein LOC101736921 [Bombyx mori]|uniref:Odorant receptor n=2 Tax=Bombyx mori TaxID=7091 RepID=A0A8R2C521_BOMMO|nr:uncharacterized protein LOC101736921 isoform X1 [Bombyx mori]
MDFYRYCNQNIILFTIGAIANTLMLISLCHGIHKMEIPHITEAGTYCIVLSYKLLILSCTKINVVHYENLLKSMKEDFKYIFTNGKKYRERFFGLQLVTWKISLFSVIFTFSIPVGMIISAFGSLLYYLLTNESRNGNKRPLLFPFYIHGVDFGDTPIYEIAFTFSNICTLAYAYNYIFMIQTQIVWVRQITSKADIIIWNLQDLLRDIYPPINETQRAYFLNLIKHRMRDIVRQHQSMYSLMEDYSQVYKKLLLFEQKCCGPVVCLTAYCATEKLAEGELNVVLILLCVGTIVMHYIPSHLCTFLTIKVRSICDACWDTPFWNADKAIRPYIVLIMQRSLRPLPLRAAGFEDICIQTFSRKMTSAYSYFNMLRQANRK